jgi:hypothetical protein
VPAIVALGVRATGDALWQPLLHAVLQCCRHRYDL